MLTGAVSARPELRVMECVLSERRANFMKRLVVISLIALVPLLASCNTIQGVGKDITAVGKGVEKATK